MSTYRSRIYENYGKMFQDTAEHFDRQAARRWGRAQSWYLRHWLPENKSARIVDLACGAGRLLHYFLEQGYSRVEGVDISPDQVALSRQIVPGVTQGNVSRFQKSSPATLCGRNERLCKNTKCCISTTCGVLHNLGLRRDKPAGELLKLAQCD